MTIPSAPQEAPPSPVGLCRSTHPPESANWFRHIAITEKAMTNIPPIPLDRDRFIDIDDASNIGKIVVVQDPEDRESCLGMITRRPVGFQDGGLAFLTGSHSGTVIFRNDALTEPYAIDVTDLVVFTIEDAAPVRSRPSTSMDVAIGTNTDQRIYTVLFEFGGEQPHRAPLIVHGTGIGGFLPRSHLVTIGRLGVQWKLS